MAAQIASHEIPAFLFWPIAAGGAVVSPWTRYKDKVCTDLQGYLDILLHHL